MLGAKATVTIVRPCDSAADFDDDCDVDQEDYGELSACLYGPEAFPGACIVRDITGQGAINLRDFARLQHSFNGQATE